MVKSKTVLIAENQAVAEFVALDMYIKRGGHLTQEALRQRLLYLKSEGVLPKSSNPKSLASDVHRRGSFSVRRV